MTKAGQNELKTIVLGGGCFWCLDAVYRRVQGVEEVVSGYAGGNWPDPTYERIESGTTGHAQVVRLKFRPEITSLEELLEIFWVIHDPTSLNRQQYDEGPQYRSVILYTGEEQKSVVKKSLAAAQKLFDKPIVTEIKPLDKFYEAEPGHQDFYSSGKRPDYCQVIIDPKLAKLRAKFASKLKEPA